MAYNIAVIEADSNEDLEQEFDKYVRANHDEKLVIVGTSHNVVWHPEQKRMIYSVCVLTK